MFSGLTGPPLILMYELLKVPKVGLDVASAAARKHWPAACICCMLQATSKLVPLPTLKGCELQTAVCGAPDDTEPIA